MYTSGVSPLVDALFKGHNGFVAAFGQANSGKSFTMSASRHSGKEIPGMVTLATQDILDRVAALVPSAKGVCCCCCYCCWGRCR